MYRQMFMIGKMGTENPVLLPAHKIRTSFGLKKIIVIVSKLPKRKAPYFYEALTN